MVLTPIDDKDNEVVLITGITGYIATEVAKSTIDAGFKYIRGTVRNKDKAMTTLVKLFRFAEEQGAVIDLFVADMLKPETVSKAVSEPMELPDGVKKNITLVLHVASPFPAGHPKKASDILSPAIEGTKAVLEAVDATDGVVKQVVVTSSIYACSSCHTPQTLKKNEKGQYVLDETLYGYTVDHSKVTRDQAYPMSKTFAEKYAWELWEKSGKQKWGLSTVLPGGVFGASRANVLSADQLLKSTSMNAIFYGFVKGVFAMAPEIKIMVSDVEDVAQIHVACLGNEKAVGKRFIVGNSEDSFNFLYDVNTNINIGVKEKLPSDYMFEGEPIKELKNGKAPYFMVRLLVAFRKFDKHLIRQWKMDLTLDPKWPAQNKDILGIQCRPLPETCAQGVEMWNEIVYKEKKMLD